MTAFSRALILAGFVAAASASGALADTRDRDIARPQNDNTHHYASLVHEGRASAFGAAPAQQEDNSQLQNRRSSEYNHR